MSFRIEYFSLDKEKLSFVKMGLSSFMLEHTNQMLEAQISKGAIIIVRSKGEALSHG